MGAKFLLRLPMADYNRNIKLNSEKIMNHLSQIITNLFSSVSIRLIVAAGIILILLQAWKEKVSVTYKAYKKRKRIREIERQIWWIE